MTDTCQLTTVVTVAVLLNPFRGATVLWPLWMCDVTSFRSYDALLLSMGIYVHDTVVMSKQIH
jgi:hypothetical protein